MIDLENEKKVNKVRDREKYRKYLFIFLINWLDLHILSVKKIEILNRILTSKYQHIYRYQLSYIY